MFKAKRSSKCNQNVEIFFIFLFIYLFILLSEAKYKVKNGKGIKILTSKQMLQRLPIPLDQVTEVNTYEKSLNEIR